jgi:hypothetical protein
VHFCGQIRKTFNCLSIPEIVQKAKLLVTTNKMKKLKLRHDMARISINLSEEKSFCSSFPY